MTVTCPECHSVFRIDPAKVPETGVRARCSICGGVLAISGGTLAVAVTPAPASAGSSVFAPPLRRTPPFTTPIGAVPAVDGGTPGNPLGNPFLQTDPAQRARRLARALVSDLVAYHPQKREEGLREGTLRELFREEIKRSYEEYVEQVGRTEAESTPHFRDALNEILAGGRPLF